MLLIKARKANQDKMVEFALNRHIKSLELVTELDIIQTLGMSLHDYHLMESIVLAEDITDNEKKIINQIQKLINSHMGALQLANKKIILGGGRVSKTTMSYITNKKEDERRELVTINVNIKGVDPVTLEDLLLAGTKKGGDNEEWD